MKIYLVYINESIIFVFMEIYKDIKGFEAIYQISNFGSVRSLDRLVRSHEDKTRKIKGKLYSPYLGLRGYRVITLRVGKTVKVRYIHRLLAETFIPNPENKPCVNHKNGNKLDNTLSNLEWTTYKENNNHARDIGLWRGKHKMS
jgi:hypothetical protein